MAPLAVSSLSVVAPGFPPVCGGPDGWRLPRRSWSGSGSPASSLAILLRMPFNRKNIRLAPQNYLGYGTYFVTICSHNRNPRFADISFGHVALGHLISLSARHSFLLHAFCLMPDHLHFLSEGNSPRSNLLRFVTAFKRRTALAYKNRTAGPLWQTKFYDHILRAPDQVESVACYIWAGCRSLRFKGCGF